jgi:hypothetical protein
LRSTLSKIREVRELIDRVHPDCDLEPLLEAGDTLRT